MLFSCLFLGLESTTSSSRQTIFYVQYDTYMTVNKTISAQSMHCLTHCIYVLQKNVTFYYTMHHLTQHLLHGHRKSDLYNLWPGAGHWGFVWQCCTPATWNLLTVGALVLSRWPVPFHQSKDCILLIKYTYICPGLMTNLYLGNNHSYK